MIVNSMLERLETVFGRLNEKTVLALIILGALALRVARALLTSVVNSDAAVYLYQAKALYYGMWSAVNGCTIKQLTAHPILSACIYFLTRDWILSMRTVSILFGTLTLIPIFGLARLFFSFRTSCIVTLLYAVMHVFVSVSVDVGRDTAYWFFAAGGLYFFASGMKRNRMGELSLASIAFVLAAWNRIEGILYFVVTALFLLFVKKAGKGRSLLFYFSPVLLGLAAFMAFHLMLAPEISAFRLKAVPEKMLYAVDAYRGLRASLSGFIRTPPAGIPFEFFENVRTLLWLLGLGVVLENAAEAFFYPFFALFLAGLAGARRRLRSDGLALYFLLLCLAGFALLYVYVFTNWSMENRYLALVILPAFLFLGTGVDMCRSWLQQKSRLGEARIAALLVLLILILALPKQLHRHEADKGVFREIGQFIAAREDLTKPVNVLTLGTAARWISLYSNLDVPGIVCPDEDMLAGISPARIVGSSYADFMKTVDARRVRYVLWEERHWPSPQFNLPEHYSPVDFRIVGEWNHRDTGRMLLFQRR